jgi:hypothetical protein
MDGVLRGYFRDVENGHEEMIWFIKKRVTPILEVFKEVVFKNVFQ